MTTRDKILAALPKYTEKPSGTYRMNSPFRAGSDSKSFVVKLTDDEHGAYYDHVSGEKGSLYELADKLGIEVERQQVESSKRDYNGLADYAAAHGIDESVLIEAKWVDVGMVEDFNNDQKQMRHALKFPTKSGDRYRFIDGLQPRYKPVAKSGYKACWYGLDKAIALAQKSNQPLVICNGEISTITAQHYGIAACAKTAGESVLPDDMVDELKAKWNGKIILAYDCDATGKRVSHDIEKQLGEATIVDLGLTDAGDLADFCRLYTMDSVHEFEKRIVRFDLEPATDLAPLTAALQLVANAVKDAKPEITLEDALNKAQLQIDDVRIKSQTARILSFAELGDDNLLRLEDVRKNPGYRGLLTRIPKLDAAVGSFMGGRVHMIYGATNMGKSTLAISILREFINQGSGYVVTTEMPPHAWQNKLIACMGRITYDKIEEGRLSDWEYKEYRENMASLMKMNCHVHDKTSPTVQEIGTAIRRGAEEYGYRWVLVDSINRLSAPGTNGIYERTTAVADSLQELALETGLTFIVTSQVGRQIRDRGSKTPVPEDGYGSGSIEQNADVIMSLYNHNHYVEMGTAEPDINFPENSALIRVVKHRWRVARTVGVMLSLVGGAGFYEMDTVNLNDPDPIVMAKYTQQDVEF